jgi:hypothetical protein
VAAGGNESAQEGREVRHVRNIKQKHSSCVNRSSAFTAELTTTQPFSHNSICWRIQGLLPPFKVNAGSPGGTMPSRAG